MTSSGVRFPLLLLALSALIITLISACGDRKAQQESSVITIRLVHGPELKSFISSLKQHFEQSKTKISDGRVIALEPIELQSANAAHKISSGELKTEAWFAQSPSYVEFVNTHLSNLGPKQVDCQDLFGTPVVAAVNSLDRPLFSPIDNTFSWLSSLGAYFEFEAAQNTNPKFSLILPIPKTSISGLSSLAQLAYLSLRDRKSALAVETLKSPATLQKMKQYQSIALNYATDEATVLQRMTATNHRPGLFTITTEQQLAIFNQTRGTAGSSVHALYPEEGSIWDQYSLCTSDADWVTAAHRAALREVYETLKSEHGQLLAKKMGFRPTQMVIGEMAPLTAQYGIDTSLPKTSLAPMSSAAMSYLLDHWVDIARPAAILLLVDASGSTDDILNASQAEIRNWLARSSPRDLKAILAFAEEIKAQTDFTSDVAKLIDTLNVQKSLGGSAVYDAIKRSLDLLANKNLAQHRKTLLIVTDGEDKNSQSSFERIKDLLEQRMSTTSFNFVVVAIQRGTANLSDLKTLAEISGGMYLETSPANLSTVLQKALAEL